MPSQQKQNHLLRVYGTWSLSKRKSFERSIRSHIPTSPPPSPLPRPLPPLPINCLAFLNQNHLLRVYRTWSLSKRKRFERSIRSQYGSRFVKKLQETCRSSSQDKLTSQYNGESTQSVKVASVDAGVAQKVQELPTAEEDDMTKETCHSSSQGTVSSQHGSESTQSVKAASVDAGVAQQVQEIPTAEEVDMTKETCRSSSQATVSSQHGGESTQSVKAALVNAGVAQQVQGIPTAEEDVITISDSEVIAPASNLPDEIFSPNVDDASLVMDKREIVSKEDLCLQEEGGPQLGGHIGSPDDDVGGDVTGESSPCETGIDVAADSQQEVSCGEAATPMVEETEGPSLTHIGRTGGMHLYLDQQKVTFRKRKGTPRKIRKHASDGRKSTSPEGRDVDEEAYRDQQGDGSSREAVKENAEPGPMGERRDGDEDWQQEGQHRGGRADQEVSGEGSDGHWGNTHSHNESDDDEKQRGESVGDESLDTGDGKGSSMGESYRRAVQEVVDLEEDDIVILEDTEGSMSNFSPLAESTRNFIRANNSLESSRSPDTPGHEDRILQKLATIPRRKTARKQFPSPFKQQSSSAKQPSLGARKFAPHPTAQMRILSQGRYGSGSVHRMDVAGEEALLKEKVLNKSSPSLKVVCTDLKSSEVLMKQYSGGKDDFQQGPSRPLEVNESLALSAERMADSMKEKMRKRLSFASPRLETPKSGHRGGDGADPQSSIPVQLQNPELPEDGGHRDGQLSASSDAGGNLDSCRGGKEDEVQEIRKAAAKGRKGAAEKTYPTRTSAEVDMEVIQTRQMFADVLTEAKSSIKLLEEQRRGLKSPPVVAATEKNARRVSLVEKGRSQYRDEKSADDGNDLVDASEGSNPEIPEQLREGVHGVQNPSGGIRQHCGRGVDKGPILNSGMSDKTGKTTDDSEDTPMALGEGRSLTSGNFEWTRIEEIGTAGREPLDGSQDAASRDVPRQMEESINATISAPIGLVEGGEEVKVALIVGEGKENTDPAVTAGILGRKRTPAKEEGDRVTTTAFEGETLNDAADQEEQLPLSKKKKRGQSIWEGSLRRTPAKVRPFQLPQSSTRKRKAVKDEATATPKQPTATLDQGRTLREYRKVATPTEVTRSPAGRPSTSQDQSPKTTMVQFSLGQLIWGHMRGFPWWPGKVVHHFAMKRPNPPPPGHVVIQWFGDMKFSVMKQDHVLSFENFNEHLNSTFIRKRGLYRKAMYQALRVAATQVEKRFMVTATKSPKRDSTEEEKSQFQECLDEMIGWAEGGFLPAKKLVPLPEDTEIPPPPSPDRSEPKSKKTKKGTEIKAWADTRDESAEGCKKHRRAEKWKLLKNGDIKLEDFCIACGSTSALTEEHPLFVGRLCEVCRVEYLETAFMFGNDGYQCYCCICAEGKELMLCENRGCYRSFCTTCIAMMISPEEAKSVMSQDPWLCYMCQPGNVFGYLTVREDWPLRHRDFFSRDGDVDYAPLSTWPPKPLEERKPMRVLSLFDGIGTGMYVLQELGFKIDAYFASEVDPDAIKVSSVRQKGMIAQVGDVRSITSKELAEWGPFDLLIGGSPCNDLSIVNPARKGIYGGSGLLFFEYFRILNLLQRTSDPDRPLFWFFENVVFMDHQTKMAINRFFECNPVLVDAKDLSPAHRARYFWGNLPGMNRPSAVLLDSPLQLQDCLEQHCNRKAKFSKVRTITTKGNSLRQNKESQLPVEMDGVEDTLWCTELERLFGFPDHYTDVSNLNRNDRQRLLGKCWSVPVINHLLAPLKVYFQCE